MTLASLLVGVETMIILRFQNVAARLRASSIGSPSDPLEFGKRSTSSSKTILIGRLASWLGELAPIIEIRPPGKTFCSVVLPLSRDRGSFTLPFRHGVSRNIGARRSLENVSAMPLWPVGCTTRIGAGSCAT